MKARGNTTNFVCGANYMAHIISKNYTGIDWQYYIIIIIIIIKIIIIIVIVIARTAIVTKVWHGDAKFITYGSAGSVCCGDTLPFTAPLVCAARWLFGLTCSSDFHYIDVLVVST